MISSPTNALTATIYDDFSGDASDTSKWTIETYPSAYYKPAVTGYIDEYSVDTTEQVFHTAQNTVADKEVIITATRTFSPGESIEYDVNYVTSTGNGWNGIYINHAQPGIIGPIDFIGRGRMPGEVSNAPFGKYHVKISFLDAGINMTSLRPDGITEIFILNQTDALWWPDAANSTNYVLGSAWWPEGFILSPPYTFSFSTRTGHLGTGHMDYDNFTIMIMDGLVAEYHFDDDASDSSGNGNDGTIYGATFVPGISGQALSFELGDYVTANDTDLPSGATPKTLSAWVKTDGMFTSDNLYGTIFVYGVALPDDFFYVGIHNQGNVIVSQYGQSYIADGVGVVDNKWHNIVVTYDGSTYRTYVDGTLSGSRSMSTSTILMGKSYMGNGYSDSNIKFNGLIDEVRMYNRALSAEEIKALHDALVPPTCTTPIDGMIITTNTTFCPGTYNLPNGVAIGADNIELDCDGAVLIGSANNDGIDLSSRIGVTIKNCVIDNYRNDILLSFSESNTILNNTLRNSCIGGRSGPLPHCGAIVLLNSTDNMIDANTMNGNEYSIYTQYSSYNAIQDNHVFNNGEGFYFDFYSDHNTIRNNEIYSNTHYGITFDRSSSHNIAESNTLKDASQGGGFYIESSADNKIVNNNISDNYGYGI